MSSQQVMVDVARTRVRRARRLGVVSIGALAMLAVGSAAAEPLECVILPHSVLELGAGANGRLHRVNVDRADRVGAGEVLAELESEVEEANLALARTRAGMLSEVRLREAGLAFDRSRRERAQSLHARQAISDQDRDQADRDAALGHWQVELAKDKMRLARLEVTRAEALLELRSVRAPFAGVVLERYKSPGEYVDEDPILRVARLDPLRVEVIAPLEMYAALHSGMHAEVFSETDPEIGRRATVVAVDPVADPASGTFRARLELPNPQLQFLAGVKCTARVLTGPVTAAVRPDDGPHAAPDAPLVARPASASVRPADAPGFSNDEHSTQTALPPRPAVETPMAEPITRRVAQGSDSSIERPHEADADGTTVEATDSVPSGTQHSARCVNVGPIDDHYAALRAADRLLRDGFQVEQREGERRAVFGWIVLASRVAVLESPEQTMTRVRARGVQDLAPLRSGPYADRVSLGVYTNAEDAERRVNELARLDVPSEVQARTRAVTGWWLDVTLDGDDARAQIHRTLSDLAAGAVVEDVDCPPLLTARH